MLINGILVCLVALGLFVVDTFDSQTQYSGGDLRLSDIADFLAHQGGPNRGFQRNLAGLTVKMKAYAELS